jgi:hypothetical protein
MSRTDKTRPYAVKREELEQADPYRARRRWAFGWRHEFRCGHTCSCSYGWWEQQKGKARRERKLSARNWEKEY